MQTSPLVTTIILNTNRKADTLAALESLKVGNYPNHKVIVLDNSSTDGSVGEIQTTFPETEIIELKHNSGYAGNNNVGIQAALKLSAQWVFVLNEDTILAPDCVSRLVEVGESDLSIGIVGPMVYHFDEPNVIQSSGGKMDRYWRVWHQSQNELDVGQFKTPQVVDWISGCAILVRRSVIEQIGGLDDRFFYYWEETEWCLRAREHGWKVVQVPDAKLWHKGVQRNYQPNPNVTYYNTRNRLMLLSKHKAPKAAWLVAWGETFRTLISWTIKPKWKFMAKHKQAMWLGILDFLRHRWGKMPG